LLAGCVGIPTGGGVTTDQIDSSDTDEDLTSLPAGPARDASPTEIIAGFISAGRGPQKNYDVARQYLTDDFRLSWIPGARTLISSTPISPVSLADNTWLVTVTASASLDANGHYTVTSDSVDLPFGLVKDDKGQWRISSAPDGTLLPPNRFTGIFKAYDLFFFDPTFAFLVPDRRWFPSGSNVAKRLVDQLLLGPSPWQGSGVLFSAFPVGTEQGDPPEISSGTATVTLSSEVQGADTPTKRRMLQQLTESLGSVSSIRDVTIISGGFTLPVPDGPSTADRQYLVGNDPVGGLDDRVGIITDSGVSTLDASGRVADTLGVTAGSLSRSRTAMAVRGKDGRVSLIRNGAEPVVLDQRSGLIAPSLDPSGFTWTVPAKSPGALHAIAPDGTVFPVSGLPTDGRIVSLDVSRDGARVLAALDTASGPRLIVAGVLRNADDAPTGLSSSVIDLHVGSADIVDAAWVDGVTVVALSGSGDEASVAAYVIGGQSTSLGSPANGVSIVGGNGLEGTRVLDDEGNVLRPGGGRSWQGTGLVASFLATQQ
ncbi:MAG TPA: LpqB family beta-propeller domain-containing protein, partial [Pseudolysinimonas sp.]